MAPSRRTGVESLLNRLAVPPEAYFLRDALLNLYPSLKRLAETSHSAVVDAFDLAWDLVAAILRQPRLSDDHELSINHIKCLPVYKALVTPNPGTDWTAEALLDSLVAALILDLPAASIDNLAGAVSGHRVSPSVRLESPEPLLARLTLLGIHLANLQKQHPDLVDAIHEVVSRLTPGDAPQPDQRNIELVIDAAKGPKPRQAIPKSDSARLQELSISLAARLGAAIRDDHLPAIRFYPGDQETAVLRRILTKEASSPDLASGVILLFTVLGQFAEAVLRLTADQPVSHTVVDGDDGPYLQVSAPKLHDPTHSYTGQDYEGVAQILNLPLPRALCPLIDQIRVELDAERHGLRDGNSVLHRAARKLRTAGRESGITLALKHTKRFLAARLEPGVIDKSVLHLLGLSTREQRDAGVYYFSPSQAVLRTKFTDAITTIADAIGRPEVARQGWTRIPVDTDTWFGASMRLSVPTFRKLIDFLVTRASTPPGRQPLVRLIDALNARAALVTLRFLAGTGARPTENVFPNDALFDTTSGLALQSEKDSLLYRSTRIAYLVPGIASDLMALHRIERQLQARHGWAISGNAAVYLLGPDGTMVPPTIPNMKRLISGFSDHWPWQRSDVLRHHFRSRAWELGCSSDCLARVLGHTSKTQTADNRLATRPLEDWNRLAEPYIKEMLDELGLACI